MTVLDLRQDGLPESFALRAALIAEHDDLDSAITALLVAGTCDDLLIRRLKKRKLQLKDALALLPPELPRLEMCGAAG